MDSPLGRSLGEYPRWTGDFTLPRLRAKLAHKNSLHPDVEPDYLEIYRSDLRRTAMVRDPTRPRDMMGATWGAGSGFGGLASMGLTTGTGANWHLTRDPSAMTTPTWRSALSEPRHVPRSGSVPALGVKRTERAPSNMLQLPRDGSQKTLKTPSSPQMGPGVAMSPSGIPISPSADERRDIDKERSTLGASKKLWGAVHGMEPLMNRFLEDTKEEARDAGTEISNNALLSRLSKEPYPAFKLALKAGADWNWRNPEWDGATLMVKSVRTGASAIVMYLLAVGADHTISDNSGRGLLHWAALEGNAELVEYFLDNLPDDYGINTVDDPDHGGDRPIHLAAYGGHLEVVLLLIRAGADTSLINGGGHTPADLAEAARMWDVVSYLAEHVQKDGDKEKSAQSLDKKDGPAGIYDMMLPYDKFRAEQVREAMKDMKAKDMPDLSLQFWPRPKIKKEEKKKDDKAKKK